MRSISFKCIDCGMNTKAKEYYSLHDAVWFKAHSSKHGMLCIGCVERRLGRRLMPSDFNDAPINKLFDDDGIRWPASERLRSRREGWPAFVQMELFGK